MYGHDGYRRSGTSGGHSTRQNPATRDVSNAVNDMSLQQEEEEVTQLEMVTVEGQRLDVDSMVADEIGRFVLSTFASLAADMAAYSNQRGLLYDRHRANTPVGSVIRERDGRFTASRPDPFAAQGLEPDGRMHFVSGLTPIRQATALVIGLPGFRDERFLIDNASFYNALSAQIGGPVYVGTTGRYRGVFYVFGGN